MFRKGVCSLISEQQSLNLCFLVARFLNSMKTKLTHDYFSNHYSCLRKYKPHSIVVENIVRNIDNRANHHVRERLSETNNPIALNIIPYTSKRQVPPNSIFFPRFIVFSSELHIHNFVLNLLGGYL